MTKDIKNLNVKSKNLIILVWIILSTAALYIGIKTKNMSTTLAILVGFLVLVFALKKTKRLIYVHIIYVLSINILIAKCGVPYMANYMLDILNILTFIVALAKYIKNRQILNTKLLTLIVFSMLGFSIIGLLINGQSILLFLWSLRNVYRFFIFMFSCIVLLEKEDIKYIFNIFFTFLVINVLLCSYQYFIEGLLQDDVGGTFGTSSGSNGYMNIFLIINCTYAFVEYLNKRKSFSYFITTACMSLYIATISEIRFFYIEFLIIAILSVLLTKFNKKTFLLIVVSVIVVYVGINALYTIYPRFKDFFNLENIIESASEGGYSAKGQLNRLSAIKTIDDMFLTDNLKKLFGIGMGNAETSNIPILTSEFYNLYGVTLRYNWFSHAFMLIENGYIGLILYISFFVAIFYESIKKKKIGKEKSIYSFVQIISILCILMMWYNGSLRTEAGYMCFLALSIGYICNKKDKYKKLQGERKEDK